MRNSLQHQLTRISFLASGAALLLAIATLLAWDVYTLRRETIAAVTRLAQLVAVNAEVAVAFDNADDARAIVGTLRIEPHVVHACVQRGDGSVLTCYQRSEAGGAPALTAADGHAFTRDGLVVVAPITVNGKRLGSVHLLSDYGALYARMAQFGLVIFLVLLAAAAVSFLLSSRLQRAVSKPILDLVDSMAHVAAARDYAVRVATDRSDEIGALSAGFNQMLAQIQRRDEQLAITQRELLEASHLAGMSEVATDVLHNVGNVLNSVNVSCTLIAERLRALKLDGLGRVAEMLNAPERDPAVFLGGEGRSVPRFLSVLAGHLSDERGALVGEVEALARHVEHINVVVAQQQAYAKSVGVREQLMVEEVVEHALELNAARLSRHSVRVERHFAPVPSLNIERHKLVQILVNLIANAIQALQTVKPAERRIVVSIAATESGAARVTVTDNGAGIAPEHLIKIFQHGFTTKSDGHGFGLHSAALSATDLGGILRAESAGLEQGATFVLELPSGDAGDGAPGRDTAAPSGEAASNGSAPGANGRLPGRDGSATAAGEEVHR